MHTHTESVFWKTVPEGSTQTETIYLIIFFNGSRTLEPELLQRRFEPEEIL